MLKSYQFVNVLSINILRLKPLFEDEQKPGIRMATPLLRPYFASFAAVRHAASCTNVKQPSKATQHHAPSFYFILRRIMF